MGMALFDSLFLALLISVTSTIIVMRVLEELGMIKDEASYLLLSVAVIEDIMIISMLPVLQSIASIGNLSVGEIGILVGVVVAFIGGALYLGSKIAPRLVDAMGKTNQYDLILITALGVAFGLAFIADLIGISVATGAFFAGMLVAESKVQTIAKIMTMPVRDMFGALFIVSLGALMDTKLLPSFIVPALILIAASFAAKLGNVFISARVQASTKRYLQELGLDYLRLAVNCRGHSQGRRGCWSYKRIPHVSDRIYDDYYDILVSIPYRAGMENY